MEMMKFARKAILSKSQGHSSIFMHSYITCRYYQMKAKVLAALISHEYQPVDTFWLGLAVSNHTLAIFVH